MLEYFDDPRPQRKAADEAPQRKADYKPSMPDSVPVAQEATASEPQAVKQPLASSAEARRGGDKRTKARPERSSEAVVEPYRPLVLPPLPQQTAPTWGLRISFATFVLLPILCATYYYEVLASNQYVAEFRFAVRDTTETVGSATSGLASILGSGATPNVSENYMVTDYLTSQQAIQDVMKKFDVKAMYTRPDVDWWARFRGNSMESFAAYWRRMVTASYDQVTGNAIAEVRAFTPEDAYQLATTLVTLSEELVNKVSLRPQREAVHNAERELAIAEQRLKAIRSQLSVFRNREGVIDPTTSVVINNVTLAQSIRATLSQYETELSGLRKQKLGAGAQAIQVLQTKIEATREQLALVESEISGSRAKGNAISDVVGR